MSKIIHTVNLHLCLLVTIPTYLGSNKLSENLIPPLSLLLYTSLTEFEDDILKMLYPVVELTVSDLKIYKNNKIMIIKHNSYVILMIHK